MGVALREKLGKTWALGRVGRKILEFFSGKLGAFGRQCSRAAYMGDDGQVSDMGITGTEQEMGLRHELLLWQDDAVKCIDHCMQVIYGMTGEELRREVVMQRKCMALRVSGEKSYFLPFFNVRLEGPGKGTETLMLSKSGDEEFVGLEELERRFYLRCGDYFGKE